MTAAGFPGAVRRLAVRVTPDALRQVRGGHPWVYEGSIRSITPQAAGGAAGDLAVVFDEKRRFVAIGLWDPGSPLCLRVLHRGAPRTLDQRWLEGVVAAALSLRAPLLADDGTTGYRVVHGEDDDLPGVVVDRYGDVAVLKLYTPAWLPHVDALAAAVVAVTGVRSVVLRLARIVGRDHARTILGPAVTGPVGFSELGLRFEADPVHGQKTGWFLDQRDNRALVAAASAGRSVLDVFCAGGGFTVHALAGGAARVVSVDVSAAAIEATRANVARNRGSDRLTTTVGDAYAVLEDLGQAGRRFDVVVVDPPSFAARQDQVPRAIDAYARLTAAAAPLVAPGGLLVQASCSRRVDADRFFATVLGSARRAGVEVEVERKTFQPLDHPTGFVHGRYLKALYLRRS